jgi:hypothetical protein
MVDANDPGAGDPWSIRNAGWQRFFAAIELGVQSSAVSAAAAEASGLSWTGQGGTAFHTMVDAALPDLGVLMESMNATAGALTTYADLVQQIKDEQTVLERRRASLQDERDDLSAAWTTAHRSAQGPYVTDDDALERADLIRGEIRLLDGDLGAVQSEWDALIERRSRADADVMNALRSREARGALHEFANADTNGLDAAELLQLLGTMSTSDLRALATAHPDLLESLQRARPGDVAAWWAGLGDGSAQTTPQQRSLIDNLPMLLGSLGGLPPLVRVAANRLNAKTRLAAIAEREDALNTPDPRGGRYSMNRANEAELERLRLERAYLERVWDGTVQLYLYEPREQNIVEMIGTPSESTTDVLTYVPGTFTSMHSFYGSDHGVQDVGRYLNARDPGIVTFVWKEGAFPGEDSRTGDADLFRILEANDEDTALQAGARLARFQDEIHTSSDILANVDQNGMGHSWGLVALASSEVKGAEYDQVHSLAGAGMPSAWSADADTSYHHWAYTDALTMAQETGAVWDGNIPVRDPAFQSTVYESDGDFTLYLPTGAPHGTVSPYSEPPSMPASTQALDNHNRIARDSEDNQSALRDILRAVQR